MANPNPNRTPGIVLISTGGVVRYSTQALVGPTAENALKELRADKLFLMVSGITLDFGLSHHPIAEVTIKQAMIRSAREVYVLKTTPFSAPRWAPRWRHWRHLTN
jgi:DeoR family fructose operon transcriptional repressor